MGSAENPQVGRNQPAGVNYAGRGYIYIVPPDRLTDNGKDTTKYYRHNVKSSGHSILQC